jgi:hypothetical protein
VFYNCIQKKNYSLLKHLCKDLSSKVNEKGLHGVHILTFLPKLINDLDIFTLFESNLCVHAEVLNEFNEFGITHF